MYYYYKNNEYVGCGNEAECEGCEARTTPPELPPTPNPRIAEIVTEIGLIEKKKLRSMSDIVAGKPNKSDPTGKTSKEYFEEYESQLETLRAELATL